MVHRLIGLLAAPLACLLISPALAAPSAPLSQLTQLEQGKFIEFAAPYQSAQEEYEQNQITDLQLSARFAAAAMPPQAALEPLLDKWVETYPLSYVALVVRADYHYSRAFAVRGRQALADTTTAQTAGFNAALIKARADLEKAIPLTARPTLASARLIQVNGKLGMLDAFGSIMTAASVADPANVLVASAILGELSPQAGGSHESMLAFIDQQIKEGRINAQQATYLESVVLSAMALSAREQGKYNEAAAFYKQAWAKEIAFDPALRDGLAGYTLTLYLQSVALGNQGREPEVYQALNTLLQDETYADRGRYYGLRGEVRLRHLKDAAGAWSDFQKGAALADPFSLFKMGVTYCQGLAGVVKVDKTACIANLKQAASRGSTEARDTLSKISPQTHLYMPDLDPDIFWTTQPPPTDILLLNITNSLKPPEQDKLVQDLQAVFQIPVKIVNSKHPIELAYNTSRGEYFAPAITQLDPLFRIQTMKPGQIVIALVGSKLYAGNGESVLGWTLPFERRSVISVAQVTEPNSLLFVRLKKLIMRSIGLSARLAESRCVMSYAATVAELDRLPDTYCPEDMKALGALGVMGDPASGSLGGIKAALTPGKSSGLGSYKMLLVTVILIGGLGYIYLVAKPKADLARKSDNPDRIAIEAVLKDRHERGLIRKKEYVAELRALYKMSPTELSIKKTTLGLKDPAA